MVLLWYITSVSPTKRADKQTTKLVVELSEIANEALVREPLDE